MKLYRRSVVALAVVMAACSDPTSPPAPITSLPRDLTASENKVIAASNDFAFDLFRTGNAAQHRENVFVSPLSASMALGMTANGAEGATYDEMRSTLKLNGATREDVNAGYKSLIALLRGLDQKTDFRIANSIWYDKTLPVNASFLADSKQYFDARVDGLDFGSGSALPTINTWVNDATGGKIPTLLDAIEPGEVMFLINAIYFKGVWERQFDKSKTAPATFYAADGSTRTVQMMERSPGVDLVGTSEYEAADLPYGNSAFTMTVVVPNTMDIDKFAESFDQAKWDALVGSLQPTNLKVYLPKFRMTWERVLNDDLQSLGMHLAFTAADFSRMSPLGKDLYLTRVVQKTFVDVDEEGTEAAAATAAGVGIVSLPVAFTVDRPFLVVLRERFSGTILFIGKIAKLPA